MKKLLLIFVCCWGLLGCEKLLIEDTPSATVALKLNFMIPPGSGHASLKSSDGREMEDALFNTIAPSEAGIEKVLLQVYKPSGELVDEEELDVAQMQANISLSPGEYRFVALASNSSKCPSGAFGFDGCDPIPEAKPWYMRFLGECTQKVSIHQGNVAIDAQLKNAVAHFYFAAPEDNDFAEVKNLYRVFYREEDGNVRKMEITVPEASDTDDPLGTIDPVYMDFGGTGPLVLVRVPMLLQYQGEIYNRWQLGNGSDEKQDYEYALFASEDMIVEDGFSIHPKEGAEPVEKASFTLEPNTQVFFSTLHHPAYLMVKNMNNQTQIILNTLRGGQIIDLDENGKNQMEALLNVENSGLRIEGIEMEAIYNGQLSGEVTEFKLNGVALSQDPLLIGEGLQAEVYVTTEKKSSNSQNKSLSQVGVVLSKE